MTTNKQLDVAGLHMTTTGIKSKPEQSSIFSCWAFKNTERLARRKITTKLEVNEFSNNYKICTLGNASVGQITS